MCDQCIHATVDEVCPADLLNGADQNAFLMYQKDSLLGWKTALTLVNCLEYCLRDLTAWQMVSNDQWSLVKVAIFEQLDLGCDF